ncbi:hypothetical protein LCGC14_0709730 [marine sediment metagenome]|uniref:Phosphate acetyl/butaryl transferase domain-containing protein n=1 Tax=marine sediment metagenome TaxID=412755 RepID=A0A0F9QFH6_9ZZZZ
MNILQKFESKIKDRITNIGIGLGNLEIQNRKILNANINFLKNHNSKIFFISNKSSIDLIRNQNSYKKLKSHINLIECGNPEKNIFEFLDNNVIHALVRGSFSSSEFLNNLKMYFKVKEVNRIALLETIEGHQFFFGPVGIDECNDLKKKLTFIELALNELESLNITANISILSGGRASDLGRDNIVDKSIEEANKIIEFMKGKYPDLNISHDEILVENAISNKSNLIIAPDGISGNLIYRTLVHLGGGKAYGAIYMGLKKVIIDTSRVAKLSEIQGALLLALALSN